MAQITDRGLILRTEAEYRELITDIFRFALGEDMSTRPQSPQMRFVDRFSAIFGNGEQVLARIRSGFNVNTAVDEQLDAIGALIGVARIQGTRTEVTCTCGGVPGTVIAAGARVRSTDEKIFELRTTVTIGAGGTVDGEFQAVEVGRVLVDAGDVTRILTLTQGWNTVTNAEAGNPGIATELDRAYTVRIKAAQARNSAGSVEAVRARVSTVDDVRDVIVLENRGEKPATFRGVTVQPGAFCAVVWGGESADIAQAIYDAIRTDDPTNGNETVTITPTTAPLGDVTVQYQTVTEISVKIVATIRGDSSFPTDGLSQVRENLTAWWAGDWSVPSTGLSSALVGIGILPTAQDLYGPVLVVPGASVQSVEIQRISDDKVVASVDLDEVLTLASVNLTYTA